MRSMVEHSFDAAYNRVNAQIEKFSLIAQSTGVYLLNCDLSQKQIRSISAFNYSHVDYLEVLSFMIKVQNSNTVQYYNCTKDSHLNIGDAESEIINYGKDNLLTIREDTVLYNYHYVDSGDTIFLRYAFDLRYFIDILDKESGDIGSRYYLFDKDNLPIRSATKRITQQSEEEFFQDVETVKPFVAEGRSGIVTAKEAHSRRAFFIRKIDALDLTLVTSMQVDLVLKQFNRYFRITFLITLLFMVLLSYALQRIIVRITRPISELSDISKKIQQGSLHTPVPVFSGTGESSEIADALRTVQGKMKQYVTDLNSTLKTKRELEHELKIANKIQSDMIPAPFEALQGRSEVDLYAKMNPAKGVAGDFYDYFFIDDQKLFFVIGDVSGKGIPAALFMVRATTLIEHTIKLHPDPAKTFEIVNKNLCVRNEESMFVTAICGLIDLKSGELLLCDAGHNTPFIAENNSEFKYQEINKGRPLGVIEQSYYSNTVFNLKAFETLLLYTDGFPECVGKSGNMIGEQKLLEQLAGVSPKELTRIADSLWNFVNDFRVDTPPSDDTTLLILRYLGSDGEGISN